MLVILIMKLKTCVSFNRDRWFVGSWSPCSLSCGEGRQVRRVHCEKETLNGIEMVDEILCPGDKAITQRKCIVLEECPKWTLGDWSKVTVVCMISAVYGK